MDEKQMGEARDLIRQIRFLNGEKKKRFLENVTLLPNDMKALRLLYGDSIDRKQEHLEVQLKTLGFTGDISDGG